MAAEPSDAAHAPARRIHRLDEATVDRIAAGEVVVRPVSVVKELLENSLDAGSTSIAVTAANGGLKLLQVQDDGVGIHREDMPMVCERFTTSKLRTYEDLASIGTFGFRGEALASVSHVARVHIVSMTRDAPCAYSAWYKDGKLDTEAGRGAGAGVTPCAGVPGTQITVHDLFYNNAPRLAALKVPSEEYRRIVDVVTRYAIHYAARGVRFSCRKQGGASADVNTTAGLGTRGAIRSLYSRELERELVPVSLSLVERVGEEDGGGGEGAGEPVELEAQGLVTNANFTLPKGVFILFINDRAVECPSLKRSLDDLFSPILPKHRHAFVYLALQLPPHHVDVNVHPTKREVGFLHEDAIVSAVVGAVRSALGAAPNAARDFAVQLPSQQQLLPQSSQQQQQAAPPGSSQTSSSASSSLYGPRSRRVHRALDDDEQPGQQKEEEDDDGEGDDDTAPSGPAGARRGSRQDRAEEEDEEAQEEGEGEEEEEGGARRRRRSDRRAMEGARSGSVGSRDSGVGGGGSSATQRSVAAAPSRKVRTDVRSQRLDAFFFSPAPPAPLPSLPARAADDCCPPAAEPIRSRRADDDVALETLMASEPDSDVAARAPTAHASASASATASASSAVAADAVGSAPPRLTNLQLARADSVASSASGSAKAAGREAFRNFTNPTDWTSVRTLRADMESALHSGLQSMIRGHSFVGFVDEQLAFVQHKTALFLLNHRRWLREFFYQQVLRRMNAVPSRRVHPPLSLARLVQTGLDAVPAIRASRGFAAFCTSRLRRRAPDGDEDGDGDGVVEAMCELLRSKRDLLAECFSVHIVDLAPASSEPASKRRARASAREEGEAGIRPTPHLTGLPILVESHEPCAEFLPLFVCALALDVQWGSEQACFQSIAQALAELYAHLPPRHPTQQDSEPSASSSSSSSSSYWVAEHVLFPAMRVALLPPGALADHHSTVQVARTEQLYRIFERC